MPSVRVRRQPTYASLREERRRSTRSSHSNDPPPLSPSGRSPRGTLDGEDSAPLHPRLSSRVYHGVRRNSLSYRNSATVPLSEQGAPPGTRPRSHTFDTGARSPGHDELFLGRDANVVANTRSPFVRAAVEGARDAEDQREDSESEYSDLDSEEHHDDDVVDHLDVIDPQVAAVTTLTNAANAIVFPPVDVFERRPTVVLPVTPGPGTPKRGSMNADSTHTDDLDKHVSHVLSKRQVFKRIMRGVWAYMKTPLGVIVTIYGILVVFWGSAIVLFLLKWINLHDKTKQDYWVEISCQIVNTLFCLTGLGMAPWRILDTYRIYKIWRMKRITRKRRLRQGLPKLLDSDDLPDPQYDPNYVHVLTDKEQTSLRYQQSKFMHSQTWYRPHGTETHRAFPIHYALWICALNVANSVFQAMLAACMWSMDLHQRPAWTTGCLIPCAFLCGIVSGVLIWRGGELTKRTKRVEELLRVALAAQQARHQDTSVPVEKGGVVTEMEMEERKPETIAEEPEKEREEETPGTSSRRMLEDGDDALCASPIADSLGSATALDRRSS
ncbi:unnamed protein product [Peniophora sp. CBMAI 1063]|nr:unnamed protein product [Peniophora sp. CBMAI 1063]